MSYFYLFIVSKLTPAQAKIRSFVEEKYSFELCFVSCWYKSVNERRNVAHSDCLIRFSSSSPCRRMCLDVWSDNLGDEELLKTLEISSIIVWSISMCTTGQISEQDHITMPRERRKTMKINKLFSLVKHFSIGKFPNQSRNER